jgi:hypothetical protein
MTKNTDGKATLAAQDIRFARTIERIQRIIVSELYKVAIIHLYTQGYRDEQLGNFELALTTPSIIYDQERVALMKEKMDLATAMVDSKLFPSDYVYDKIFHVSEDEYNEFRDLIVKDYERIFRLNQIESEGNDPLKSGQSYGTPHDLASLYGKGRIYSNPANLPPGYDENDEKAPLGRPKEKVTTRNSQEDNFGKDRLGVAGTKDDYNNPTKKALAMEHAPNLSAFIKSLNALDPKKKLIFEGKKQSDNSFLDESNIKE